MLVTRNGLNVTSFTPENSEERDWLNQNTNAEPWQWLGRSLHVDTRMAEDLLCGVSEVFDIREG